MRPRESMPNKQAKHLQVTASRCLLSFLLLIHSIRGSIDSRRRGPSWHGFHRKPELLAAAYAESSSLRRLEFTLRSLSLRSSTIQYYTHNTILWRRIPPYHQPPRSPQAPFTLKPEPQPRRRNLQSARWAISFL